MKSSATTRIAWHISPQEVEEQRDRALESRAFGHADQLRKLLAYLVEHTLLNNHHRITQAMIANDVLGAADFDSLLDSGVRRLAGRLRERLRDYYSDEGRDDAIIITFPKGPPYRLIATRRHSINTAHPLDDRAFQEYRKGRSLWAMRTPESLHSAMNCFRRAIQMFPAYSMAFSALGECYFFMALWGDAPTTVIPYARSTVLQALEIDDENAEAHALLGAICSAYDWDWAAATTEFERALAIDDRAPGAYCWYSAHLVSLGRYDEAVHVVRLAQAADLPMTSVVVNAHAAKILIVGRRFDEARSLLTSLREENPNFYLATCYLGMLDGMVGREYGQAIDSLQEAAELSGQNSSVLALLGSVYARAGRTSDAENVLSVLLDRRTTMYIAATDMASSYFDLGRHDEAFNSLEQAVEEKCIFLSWLASWPPLKDLSFYPPGRRILHRLGLSS